MIKFNIIDNLEKHNRDLTDEEAEKISWLIKINTLQENKEEYTKGDIEFLNRYKSPKVIKERIRNNYLIFLTNESDEIIGCGWIIKKNNNYHLRMLHIRNDYRGQGLGKRICDIREKKLRDMGIKEVFIESLKFENTLQFNKSRGYAEVGDGKIRRYTVLMKKNL